MPDHYHAPHKSPGVDALPSKRNGHLNAATAADVAAFETQHLTVGQYERAVRAGHVGIWDWRASSGEMFICLALAGMVGCRPHMLAGRVDNWVRRIHPDDSPWLNGDRATLANTRVLHWQGEHRFRHEDGSSRWLLTHAVIDRDEDGAVIGAAGTCTDITRHKEAEQTLRQSEERHRLLIHALPVGLLEVTDMSLSFINPEALALLGEADRARILGHSLHEVIAPSSWPAVARFLTSATTEQDNAPAALSAQLMRRDGRMVNVELTLTRPPGYRGQVVHLMVRDLTDKLAAAKVRSQLSEVEQRTAAILAQAEADAAQHQLLRASKQRLRDVLNSIFGFVGLFSTDGVVLEANRAPLEAAGLTRDQVIGARFEQTYWWSYSPQVQEELLALMARAAVGETVRKDLVVRVKEGRMMTIDTVFGPLRDHEGKVIQIVGFAIDVTDRRCNEELLRSLVESTASAVGRDYFSTLLRQLTRLLGCKAAAIGIFTAATMGNASVLLSTAGSDRIEEITCDLVHSPCGQLVADQYRHFSTGLRTLFPEAKLLQSLAADSYLGLPLLDASGQIMGALLVIDDKPMPDIDMPLKIMRILAIRAAAEMERLRAEERLHAQQATLTHASRLALVGGLASGLAHELNQPLCAVANYTRASLRRLSQPEHDLAAILEDLRQAADQAERAGEIIHRLRPLVSKRTGSISDFELHQCIETCLSLFHFELTQHKVQVHLERGAPRIILHADSVQIQQVIMNLLRNALDAVAQLESEQRVVVITTRMIKSDQVECSVTDCGDVPPNLDLNMMFEPFHSTKPDGMGLGLSICRTIIESHDGSIHAARNKGPGLTLTVRLPARPSEEE